MGGILDSITSNKTLTNMLLGQLKKAVEKEGIKSILIKVDENGELDFIPYKDETVVIKKSDYDQLIKMSIQ